MRRQPSCQKIIMIAYLAYSAFQYGCLAPRRWKKEKKQRRTRTAQQRELSARCAPQREPRYPYFDRVQELFRFSVIGCSAFCMRRVRTQPESRVASARSLDAGLFEVASQRSASGTWKCAAFLFLRRLSWPCGAGRPGYRERFLRSNCAQERSGRTDRGPAEPYGTHIPNSGFPV